MYDLAILETLAYSESFHSWKCFWFEMTELCDALFLSSFSVLLSSVWASYKVMSEPTDSKMHPSGWNSMTTWLNMFCGRQSWLHKSYFLTLEKGILPAGPWSTGQPISYKFLILISVKNAIKYSLLKVMRLSIGILIEIGYQ